MSFCTNDELCNLLPGKCYNTIPLLHGIPSSCDITHATSAEDQVFLASKSWRPFKTTHPIKHPTPQQYFLQWLNCLSLQNMQKTSLFHWVLSHALKSYPLGTQQLQPRASTSAWIIQQGFPSLPPPLFFSLTKFVGPSICPKAGVLVFHSSNTNNLTCSPTRTSGPWHSHCTKCSRESLEKFRILVVTCMSIHAYPDTVAFCSCRQ